MKFKVLLIASLFFVSFVFSAHAWRLENYPQIFVKGKSLSVQIILGSNALIYDGVASSLILTSLQRYSDLHNLSFVYSITEDTYVNSPYDQNSIVIGGPCANSVASQIFNYPLSCSQGFTPGVGSIRAFDGGHPVIFVGGFFWQDTLRAAQVLSKWQNYHLNGTVTNVNVAEEPTLVVQ